MSEVSALAGKRRRRRVIYWLILVLAAGAGAAWAIVNQPWVPKPTAVAAESVRSGPASRVLAINGRVVPARQVEISSTISGRVARVAVAEGDRVAAGTLLLTLDDTQQVAAVAEAQSQVEAAKSKLTQAQQANERAKGLGDSISQKALDDARFAAQSAKDDLSRVEALLVQAKTRLAEYAVRAPFDGTVLSSGADPGQVVGSSTSLFLFADLTELNAEASVDELYAAEVHRGHRAIARPVGHTGTIEGGVQYVSPRVDASTGGRLVRVSLPGAGELSLPVGLTVMLNILVDSKLDAITIPRSALLDGDAPAVYVIEQGKAVRRAVDFIDWPSERLIVTSGLGGGEVLVADSKSVKAEGALLAPVR